MPKVEAIGAQGLTPKTVLHQVLERVEDIESLVVIGFTKSQGIRIATAGQIDAFRAVYMAETTKLHFIDISLVPRWGE